MTRTAFIICQLAIIGGVFLYGWLTTPAGARETCTRPQYEPYMRGTQCIPRIPTPEKPYCPFP